MYQSQTFLRMSLLWLGHLLVDFMIGIWPAYKTMAEIDLALAGLIAAAAPFIGEGLQPVFGNLGDRGHRKFLCCFGLLLAGTNAFLPFTERPFLLFLIFLATCVGSGAFHPSAVAFISRLTETKKGLYVAIFASGGSFGLGVSQLVFLQMMQSSSPLHPSFLFVPVAVCSLALCWTQFPEIRPFRVAKRMRFETIRSLFQDRDLKYLYLSQVCNQSIVWGCVFLLPDILTERAYPSWVALGGGHFFFIMGGGLAMIPSGYFSDYFSIKEVLLGSTLIAFSCFCTFILSPALPIFQLSALLAILGASLGLINPLAVAYGTKMLPSRPGLISAFLMGLVWCVSEALGPGVGGVLTKCFQENPATHALSALGLLFIFGYFALNQIPASPTNKPHLEEV